MILFLSILASENDNLSIKVMLNIFAFLISIVLLSGVSVILSKIVQMHCRNILKHTITVIFSSAWINSPFALAPCSASVYFYGKNTLIYIITCNRIQESTDNIEWWQLHQCSFNIKQMRTKCLVKE